MFKFQSIGDCQQRLASSLICVNGRPFWVAEVLSATVVKGYDTVIRDKTQNIDLRECCVTTPNVGYLNYNGSALFVTRRPVRRIRQGLCRENLNLSRGPISNDLICSQAFGKMILKDYPTLQAAYTDTAKNQRRPEVAFSLNFAVNHHGQLLYMGQEVGSVNTDLSVTFMSKFSCLKELYERESQRPD